MATMLFAPSPANRNRAAGVLLHRTGWFRDLREELAAMGRSYKGRQAT
ncbi:hypothetical protein [Lysobacter sp. D1-1-M9]